MNIGLIALFSVVTILTILWSVSSFVYHKYKLKMILEKNPELGCFINTIKSKYENDKRYNAKEIYL